MNDMVSFNMILNRDEISFLVDCIECFEDYQLCNVYGIDPEKLKDKLLKITSDRKFIIEQEKENNG